MPPHRPGPRRPRRGVVAALALLAGCAALPDTRRALPDDLAQCHVRFVAFDREVAARGTRYSAVAPVTGYPFLKVDRFLASFADDARAAPLREVWLRALAARDAEARRMEAAALPAAPSLAALNECRDRLVAHVLADPSAVDRVRAVARVPDEYRTWWRIAGLYPLARRVALAGVRRLQTAHPVAPAADPGAGVAYASDAVPGVSAPDWSGLPRDAFGRVRPGRAQRAALFARHAPTWRVATASSADAIGAPRWWGAELGVDPSLPVEYRYLDHTRFGDQVLTRLHYVVWFGARPAQGAIDLLAGRLDGLTWRVTLDVDGSPLAYDVMHNCGCYHQWYPGPPLVPRPPRADEEPPWTPFTLAPPPPGQRVAIHLAPGTHYVTAVTHAAPDPRAVPLAPRAYASLYRLRGPVRRGLFASDGSVPESARGERFVLWPLGVPAPGAMRGRGHHATAFVGRRHFDDARILDRLFTRSPVNGDPATVR
ncbi:MAG: hypothetical protein AB7O21_01970 [Gammaproteobacteria bacterium]